ncbi:MAG: hypothetical protein PHC89_01805 [Candidatus Pacebacteria bacterium]|nr:hypothetical protein [Candidatus Paceibacterota bacterium]
MDPLQNNQENTPFLEEKKSSSLIWYIIFFIIIALLATWYFYTNKTFEKKTPLDEALEIADMGYTDDSDEQGTLQSFIPIKSVLVVSDTSQFPPQKKILISGEFSHSCTVLNEPVLLRDVNTFYLTLTSSQGQGVCDAVPTPFETSVVISLENLNVGDYVVDINNGQERVSFSVSSHDLIDFTSALNSSK